MSFKNTQLFRLTVGKKMIFLIASLLFIAIAVLTQLSSMLFRGDTEALIQQMTIDNARRLSESIHLEIEKVAERSKTVGFFLQQTHTEEEKGGVLSEIPEEKKPMVSFLGSREEFARQLFEKDNHLQGIFLFESKEGSELLLKDSLIFEPLHKLGNIDGKNFSSILLNSSHLNLAKNNYEDTQVGSFETPEGKKMLAITAPFYREEASGKSFILTTVFSEEAWLEKFSTASFVSSFMVDHEGTVVMHPDASLVHIRHNLSNLEIVKKVLEGKLTNGQTRYWDAESKEAKIGAFSLVGIGSLAVISEVPEKRAYASVDRLQYRAFLTALAILFFACGLGYIFSKSLTWPLMQLINATERIGRGDFKTRLKAKGRDEVSELSTAFNKMAEELAERDNVNQKKTG